MKRARDPRREDGVDGWGLVYSSLEDVENRENCHFVLNPVHIRPRHKWLHKLKSRRGF